MTEVQAGDVIVVRTADDKELTKRALSPVVDGHDFPVVWAVWPEEYRQEDTEGEPARSHNRPYLRVYPPGVPWPAEDVRVASNQESKP